MEGRTDQAVLETTVFDGTRGVELGGKVYRLACGTVIAETPTGRLLVAWLSGSEVEPARDNCVLLAHSDDGGESWSQPRVLVPAMRAASAVTVLSPQPNGEVVALGAFWPAEEHYTVWEWFRMVSRDDGTSWSGRQPLCLRDGNNIALLSGFREPGGENYLPAQYFMKRNVPLAGPVRLLAVAGSEAEARALAPAGAGEPRAGKFATHLHGCSILVDRDGSLSSFEERGRVENRPLGLLEPALVRLRDGRLVMLMRAEWGGYLWRSESADDGFTWTPAWQTSIRDPPRSSSCWLPDGRIALLHNESGGVVGEKGPRDPLSVSFSEDEMESWSERVDVATGGQLAYPNGIVLRSGALGIVYDRDRRQVRMLRLEVGR